MGEDAGRVVAAALTAARVLDAEAAHDFGVLFARCHSDFGRRAAALDWSVLSQPRVTAFDELEELPASSALLTELLNKVAILKLNGGLGTSMGCRGPKATINVKAGHSFLDLTVRQVDFLNSRHGVDVPLVLMNSFRTHDTTVRALSRYANHHVTIHCFEQSRFPRLDRDTFAPLPLEPFSSATEAAWAPPGHGDVWRALDKSGLLEKLLAAGKEVIFISNVDNLAATLDIRLLHHVLTRAIPLCVCRKPQLHTGTAMLTSSRTPPLPPLVRVPSCMEVTERVRSDVQGGALVACEGKLKLLEAGLVPAERLEDFKSLRSFPDWCTNNLWASLKDIKAALAVGAILPPVLVSERTIALPGAEDGRVPVLELETAAGAAIEFFARAEAVRVPRSRFLPVKSTSDLFSVQSCLYEVRHGSLVLSPGRSTPVLPLIKLGPDFASIDAYTERVLGRAGVPPDVLEADHVSVTGNVYFGAGVKLRGTVVIAATEGQRIDIPPGAVLENVVVTGSLRILAT
jgi:UTP--glucose-1-phosphate uridylyltransferase